MEHQDNLQENMKVSLFDELVRAERILQRYRQYYGTQNEIDPHHGQGRIITLLKKVGESTQTELSYLLDIRPQSLGELLGKLENAGYIVRRHDPEDRRRTLVSLTDEGQQLELEALSMDAAFSCLQKDEQEKLSEYLKRIAVYLDEQLKAMPTYRRRMSRPLHRTPMAGEFMPPHPPYGDPNYPAPRPMPHDRTRMDELDMRPARPPYAPYGPSAANDQNELVEEE